MRCILISLSLTNKMKIKIGSICQLLMLLNFVYSVDVRIDPLVLIKQGLVRGQKSDDGQYSTFLGIPYAQVDLNNPFGPALIHPGFGGEIFEANDGTIECTQSDIRAVPLKNANNDNQSLDCLRLNIFVPGSASTKIPLPVLVWIHGGGFTRRSAGNEGIPYLVSQDIVVVMINYRLGPYGFLCLDSPLASGNQGLKDQYEALRWVRDNIASFGGDPHNVTIGGISAGSASVIYHLYSNKEKLFNKIIAIAGVPQADGLFVDGDADAAIKLTNHLGLNTNSTEQALTLLTQMSPNLVIAAFEATNLRLMPCKEKSFDGIDSFIKTTPFSLTNEIKIRNTPILIGHSSNEVFGPIETVYGDDYFNDPFAYRIQKNFNLSGDELKNAVEIARHFYIGDETISSKVYHILEQYDSDFVFNHPIHRTINGLLKENASPVFQYLFQFQDQFTVMHGIEVSYLFKTPSVELSDEGKLISKRINQLWANFVKYGNPTPQATELLPVIWEPVTQDRRPYLVIDRELSADHRVFNERMSFWDLFYLKYGEYRL